MKYFRPNLTEEQKGYLVGMLDDKLSQMKHTEADFDFAYRLRIKILDTKAISTDKRGQ